MQNKNTSASHDSEWAAICAARQQMEQATRRQTRLIWIASFATVALVWVFLLA